MLPTRLSVEPIYCYDSQIGNSFSFDLKYQDIIYYTISGYIDRNGKVIFSPFSRILKSKVSKDLGCLLSEQDLKKYYNKALSMSGYKFSRFKEH